MRTMRAGGWGVHPEPRLRGVLPAILSSLTLLRLLWSPLSLARVAAGARNGAAIVMGIFAIGALFSLHVASSVAGAEPFRDTAHLIAMWADVAVFLGVMFAAFLGMLAWMVVALRALAGMHAMRSLPRLGQARIRALFLSPITIIAPMAVWSLAAALSSAAAPTCDFYGPAGKPAWLAAPALAVVGARLWSFGILALGLFCATAALMRLGDAVPVPPPQGAEPLCQSCGYSLSGLPSFRCPECGAEPALSSEA